MKKYNASDVQILSNTAKIQAVYHHSLDMLQAIFYDRGMLTLSGMEVKTDKPCALMVKNIKGKQLIFVADPLQKEQSISLNIKDVKSGKIRQVNVDLPRKGFAGSTRVN
ncbi:Chondroitinase-AC precursor [compost metagenome]